MLVDGGNYSRVNDIAFTEESLQKGLILVLIDTLRHVLLLLLRQEELYLETFLLWSFMS
jgi:hypothetical protein